jgi:uncharacterized membrane protein
MTLEPLLNASPAIQIHAFSAITAFALGGVVLFRRKGGTTHRSLGRVWVLLMLAVAFSSFFIHTIGLWGAWSPIHLLSLGTIFSLAYGVAAIRLRNVQRHRRVMQATYVGALGIAGFFTFLPGRIMHEVLFAGTAVVEFATLAVVVVCVAAASVWAKRAGWPVGTQSLTAAERRR